MFRKYGPKGDLIRQLAIETIFASLERKWRMDGKLVPFKSWVGKFLDGEWGSDFMDIVDKYLGDGKSREQIISALKKAIAETKDWPVDEKDVRDFGVPEKMPWLDMAVFSAGYYDENDV